MQHDGDGKECSQSRGSRETETLSALVKAMAEREITGSHPVAALQEILLAGGNS